MVTSQGFQLFSVYLMISMGLRTFILWHVIKAISLGINTAQCVATIRPSIRIRNLGGKL